MTVSSDLLQAKQTLSSRLLRAGLQGNAVAMVYSFRISASVVPVGRNVHAVGVGRKIVNGEITDTSCIRLYVSQKIAPSLIPPRDLLPGTIDGIPTDVVETPPAFLMTEKSPKKPGPTKPDKTCTNNRKKRQRPVVAGISAAHVSVTAGTISYFCRSTHQGDDYSKVYVLSNNHVFADVNQAQIGDDLYQPGPADGGVSNDHFAELFRYVPIKLGGVIPNRVDAAIGELLPNIEFREEVCQIGKIKGVGQAIEDMEVYKHGRTTGLTEGTVDDESYDALVGMDHSDPSVVALFENQMRISGKPIIGLGGDSGSLVVNKSTNEAVGLYFAGPSSGTYGVANHIADVLTELQIELL